MHASIGDLERGIGVGKVFGIGLNKTGTRSLAAAMRILGYRTLHKGDNATSALVDLALTEGMPLLSHIGERYDAYFDVHAIVKSYALLDRQYPGSKFILTTRGLDGWLLSREKHVHANQERAAHGDYCGTWLTIDRDAWTAEWHEHHAAVRSHFAGRDDLIEMNVVGGDGWDVICPFLGRPTPRSGFPWENRDGAGTYTEAAMWHRAGVIGGALAGRVRRALSRR
jgi:hypothetical protein